MCNDWKYVIGKEFDLGDEFSQPTEANEPKKKATPEISISDIPF